MKPMREPHRQLRQPRRSHKKRRAEWRGNQSTHRSPASVARRVAPGSTNESISPFPTGLPLHATQRACRSHWLRPQTTHLLLEHLVGALQEVVIVGVLLNHITEITEIMDQQLDGAFTLRFTLE